MLEKELRKFFNVGDDALFSTDSLWFKLNPDVIVQITIKDRASKDNYDLLHVKLVNRRCGLIDENDFWFYKYFAKSRREVFLQSGVWFGAYPEEIEKMRTRMSQDIMNYLALFDEKED